MPRFDVTKLNVAIDRLLETTQKPRHRFMLQLFARHRALEVAGRYDEIFAPDMMAMNTEYHFTQAGIHAKGQDEDKSLYRMWADTDQSIFYVEREEVAVYRAHIEMIWPYDDQARIVGEDVYEVNPETSQIQKLDRADVLTTEQAGKLLAPFIKPLPAFDATTMGVRK